MSTDVEARLGKIAAATDRLLETVQALHDPHLAAPSLCAGWTRSHVLAHIALNADSLVNLFTWARTGIETPQYPSWERRNSDIELHSDRTVEHHLAEIRASAQRLVAAAWEVPVDRWEHGSVAGIGAEMQPASNYLRARRREVEVHHVDLDAGYGPSDWPEDFVEDELSHAEMRLSSRDHVQPFEYRDSQSGRVWTVGDGGGIRVTGDAPDLLAWLMGRSHGEGLGISGSSALPALGAWG